jgi:hypothetical protein
VSSRSRRAAAQLAEEQARAKREQRLRLLVAGAIALLAVALVTFAVKTDDRGSDATSLYTSPPPWPPKADGLAERLQRLGFPPVGDGSYHAHALLTVYRQGQQVEVPANIGFSPDGSHSSLHSHTPNGVIDMEAEDRYPYSVLEIFTLWGVALDDDRLGGDVAAGDDRLHVYVNGEPAAGGIRTVLRDGDNVVVAFGKAGSFPTLPDANALRGA